MAQKREKEETELKVPESLPLCSSITAPPQLSADIISDLKFDDSRSNSASSNTESRSTSATTPESSIYVKLRSSPATSNPELVGIDELRKSPDLVTGVKRAREASRCSGTGCRRKVGLMPFRCRCGEVFCSEHRYSDRHDCSYDYKAAAREAIARQNPLVKAPKILKL